ncbi:MAG: 8-oxo-dGTP diphosphatase [Liquorilactobacillus ghanensis]|uniref:8-oxo-dGTP diphosphatase n=1 Tax=Liquorilactobacillus ghanensis TaxID=399370 RepID=UPI0039EA1EEA
MDRSVKTTLTNMCLVYDESGRVLVENRKNPNWPGVVFPGGHVEAGESMTDATIREVYEETGLTVDALQLCGIKDWINEDGSRYIVLLYKTNSFTGTLKSSSEGEVYWVALNKLLSLQLATGMAELLELFLQADLSEQFLYQKDGKWQSKLN